MIKNYLLDTNVLLNNPQNIYGFEDNNVYICGTTLQELDSKKSFNGELGYNARECCRILDYLREKGDLIKGVKLENGGTLFVEPGGIDSSLLPKGYNLDVPDNRIISTCLYLNKSKLKDSPIILLTNDISMRVNATICGLKVQGVKNDIVEDSHYTGHIDIDVYPDAISEIYKNGSIPANSVNVQHFLENQFVTLNYDNKSALSVYQNGQLINIKEKTLFGGIRPLNKMQIYAIWALTNPDIPLVLIDGPAGSSKTFLSLAAGLSQVYLGQGRRTDSQYHHLLISRPNTQNSDPGFGFLPGQLDEKMAPLIASYKDNLEAILRNKAKDEDDEQIKMQMDNLLDETIELCPLNYIRGRSLHDSYIICDEAQNSNKLLIRDVITRAGRGSKIVVAGDPRQCDVATLDSRNNGLVYAIEHMKGSKTTAIITFEKKHCVRSILAEEAIARMP